MFEILVCGTAEEMSAEAFALIRPVIKKPAGRIALSSVLHPEGLYRRMIEEHENNGTTYRNLTLFLPNEVTGKKSDDPLSYRHFMNSHLLDCLDVPEKNIHIPNGMNPNPEEACRQYDQLIEEKPIDLLILGVSRHSHQVYMGSGNGFGKKTHVRAMSDVTREVLAEAFQTEKDRIPDQRILMGMNMVEQARRIIMLAEGKEKARAIAALVHERPEPNSPLSSIYEHHHVTLILDREAASMLMLSNSPQIGKQ